MAAGELAVEVRGAVKSFPVFPRRRDRALALLGFSRRLPRATALGGVDLEAAPGEAVGLVGENGSGKTTLLRLVAGIGEPDAGRVYARPPVAALLELGLGFHGEFTGRENALLYGALVGIDEAEMRHRLDDILAFAELGEVVDRPLRTYSSGMAARLAFAVATHVEPSVLVVDEVLAVGDGAFQRKCVERMVRFKREGRTVLYCSHALYQVAEFCERAVWLRRGQVAAAGPSREVIVAYEDYLRALRRERRGDAPALESEALARITGVEVRPAGREVQSGEPLEVLVRLQRREPGLPVHVVVAFLEEGGLCLADCYTRADGLPAIVGGQRQEIVLRLPASPFRRGKLDIIAYLLDENGLQVIDQYTCQAGLCAAADRWEPGYMVVEHQWTTG